jgi:predicted DNA-binding protein (MmcQ/YjbR family)
MTRDELIAYCLGKPGAWPDEPWEGDVVAKVGPKIAFVMAYIGRSGWNNLRVGGVIPDDEIMEAIDASYDTVVAKLPKKDRPAAPAE